jgi:branched-chain amino acid transport system permease protein
MIAIVTSGLTIGVIYALIAVSIVITFNVTGIYNFATGGISVLAGMSAAALISTGVTPVLALLVALAVSVAVSWLSALLIIPASKRLEPLALLLLTVGIALAFEGAGVFIWGPARVRFEPFISGYLEFAQGRIPYYTIALVGLSIALGVLIRLSFTKSSIGRVVRANVLDSETTRLMGIRPERLALGALLISGFIAGAVGFLITPVIGMGYSDGINLSVIGVVVAIIAGTYSPAGAIAVGVGLGVIESLAAGYLPSGSSNVAAYILLLIILLLRPQGLFGSPAAKRI